MRRRFSQLVVCTALMAGCASGDNTLDAVDPEAVAANPTYDHVFAIIQNRCVLCHESDNDDDGYDFRVTTGAEDVPGLETCTSIVALAQDILERVEDNTMPPGALPRLNSEEKLIIRRWVQNGAIAPCNPTNPN